MYYYLIAPTIIVRNEENSFTYHSEKPLAIGSIVRISVGKKNCTGVIVSATKKPSFITKAIISTLSPHPLPPALLKLSYWISTYYATHLAIVLQSILPAGLHKKRRQGTKNPSYPQRNRTKIVLNKEQTKALLLINRYSSGTILLHGITGSGKTQVYIEAAKHEQRRGYSSIILVPEIALTPQLVAEFANHFKKVIVTHSTMTEAERHAVWLDALMADEPIVIIGPRSALFMPVQNLGLIVVDECHEPSYKQEQTPRYSALRTASMLVRFHDSAKAVFGSATPSIADFYVAKTTKSPILKLTQSATTTVQPTIHVLDLKKREHFREHRFLADHLLKAIRQALENKQQVLLFHNRRGTAPTSLCVQCGWTALCSHCHIPTTLHNDLYKLICHLCGRTQPIPPQCPACGQPEIIFKGLGTKLIESEIKKLFPNATIARFDADNTAKETLQARYQQLYDGAIDIIIGTQLLAKGLDLPKLTLVGVIQADSGLLLPDYQAEERVFQLLHQVTGRVGRRNAKSEVVIQAYQVDHPVIQYALERDFSRFYEHQIRQRHNTSLPPFSYLLKLTCSYKTERGAIQAAQRMAIKLKENWPKLTILGPTPAFYERIGSHWRWQLIIKSKARTTLVEIAKAMPTHWQADLDPASLL